MYREPTRKQKRYEAILKNATDIIFKILLTVVILAILALLIWNESELIKECQSEGHSLMYCLRILG